jgi:hypothetical protein
MCGEAELPVYLTAVAVSLTGWLNVYESASPATPAGLGGAKGVLKQGEGKVSDSTVRLLS